MLLIFKILKHVALCVFPLALAILILAELLLVSLALRVVVGGAKGCVFLQLYIQP